jgi:hypothetical protein
MDSMHKHLIANKCPIHFPNKKAEVATSSGVATDFEIVTTAVAAEQEDDDSSSDEDDEDDDDKDNGTSNDGEEEEGNHGLTKLRTVCKYCVKAQGRCHLHPLK